MPTPSQLQKTAAEFKKWRANKNARSESTPLPLRRQAVTLITQYSINQVAKALGLNGSGIKRWQAEFANKDVGEPAGNEPFISLPKVAPQGSCLQKITLSFDDGGTLVLSGCTSVWRWSSRLALVITDAIWRDTISNNAQRATWECF